MNQFSFIIFFIFFVKFFLSIGIYAQSVATLPLPANYKALSSAFLTSNNIMICAKSPQASGSNGDVLYIYDLSQKTSQHFNMSCQYVGQLSDSKFFLADQTTYKFYSFSSNQISVIQSYKISSSQSGIAFYKNVNQEQIYLSFNNGSTFFGRADNLYELRYCDQTPVSDIAFNQYFLFTACGSLLLTWDLRNLSQQNSKVISPYSKYQTSSIYFLYGLPTNGSNMDIVICTSGLLITSQTQVFTMINGKYDSSTLWTAFNLLETTSNLQQFGNGIAYLSGSTLKIQIGSFSYSSVLKYSFKNYQIQQQGNQILGIDQNQSQIYIYNNFPTTIQWKQCNPICLSCDQTDQCTECYQSKYRVLKNGTCVCQKGYYQDQNNNCVKCKSNCLECTSADVCTVCDSSLNRVLSSNDCLCQQGYYEDLPNLFCFQQGSCPANCLSCDNQGKCISCNSTKHFVLQNSICVCDTGYQLNQSTQSCDSVCQAPCQSCIPGTNQCQTCMQNYYFLEGNCVSNCPSQYYQNSSSNTCDNCLVNGCYICQSSASVCNQCKQSYFYLSEVSCQLNCPKGYYENINEYKCEQCKVKGCNYCKESINTCDQCQNGLYLLKDQCLSQCPSGFVVQTQNEVQICQDELIYYDAYQEKDNQININFQSSGNIDINLLYQNLNINIPDISYSINKQITNSTSILAIIILSKEINQVLPSNVTFSDSQNLNLAYSSKQIQLKLVNQLSGSNKIAAEAISSTAQVTSKVTQAAIIPLQLSGNFRFIASLVDISQIIYIMYFLQIDIPLNLQGFFEGLEEVKVPFVNFFGQLQKNNKIVYNSPQKFEEQDIQGFFLDNFGDNMSYALLIIAIHLLLKFIIRNIILRRYEESLSKISRSVLNPKFYLDLLWSMFQELSIAVFLQIQVLQKVEYVEEVINYLFFGIGFIAIFIPFVLMYLIRNKKYDWITEPLSEEVNNKSYIIFLYIRKMYIVMSITLVQNAPLAQIILIALYHIATLVFIYKINPYKEKSDNVRHFMQTFLFLLSTLLLIFFLQNNPQNNKSIGFGWLVISTFACIILIDFIFFLKETLKSVIENLKKLKEKLSSIIDSYKEKKNSKLEAMQISETYIGNSDNKQKNLPEIQINGQKALNVKTNKYNFLSNVNAKNNNNNNTGAGSDEHSPISIQQQGITQVKPTITTSGKLSSNDLNIEIDSSTHTKELNIDEVISSIKIPSKEYQKSNFLSLANSQQKLTYSTQQLNTNTNETYTPQSTQSNLQKKSNLRHSKDSQTSNRDKKQ
ncbi:hypothetical protein ABPG74_015315 [Tetrahymena malaccensis]